MSFGMPKTHHFQRSPEALLQLLQRFIKHKKQVKQIHSHLTTNGYLLITCKWINTLLYNSLIRAYLTTFSSQPHTTLILFTHMLIHRAPPNELTFPSLLKSATCSYSPSVSGIPLHSQTLKRGVLFDPFVQTSLICLYFQLSYVRSARKLFDEVTEPCVVSCNAMLDGFGKNGDMSAAVGLFLSMRKRDVYSWTSVISGFAKNGGYREAIEFFARMMRDEDVIKGLLKPNEATFVSVLSSFDGAGALCQGKQIHGYMIKNESELSVYMGTALIAFYGKTGCLTCAVRVFETMVVKEVCTWNALISALASNGRENEALETFDKMKAEGWTPNGVTFVGVLSACARAKLVDTGLTIFRSMLPEFGIIPLMEHYGCVVDLLGRAGHLKEAYEFVQSMPFKADASVLGALLGACRVHGAVELGNEVGKRLIELQPHHCGRYVLLSSIYAGAERWDHAAALRKAMIDAGIQKIPAYSMIPE